LFKSLCRFPLSDLAKHFCRGAHCNVELSLSDRVADLVDEGFEAAIRIGSLADSRLVARRLRPYRSLLSASPEYIRRKGQPKMPQDLAAHDCLGFSYAGRRGRWRLSRGTDEKSVSSTPRMLANNCEALRQAALAGLGILSQPEILLAEDIRRKRLVRVLPTWSLPARPMHVVYAADRQATPKLQRFIEFIVKHFGAMGRDHPEELS
jgi:DNA-binding transcriptional LysR family regulator